MKVLVIRARHNPTRRWPKEHVAFLVEGSQTVLHTGDAEVSPEVFSPLRRLPRINLALIPYWHLTNPRTFTTTVIPLIKADRLLGIHVAPEDAETARRDLGRIAPSAVLLVTPGTDIEAASPAVAR